MIYLIIIKLHKFSEKLIIEDTIEMTVLFGIFIFSGGNSVNQFGD